MITRCVEFSAASPCWLLMLWGSTSPSGMGEALGPAAGAWHGGWDLRVGFYLLCGWLVERLAGLLVAWLAGLLVAWLVGCLLGCLVAWLVGCWLLGCLWFFAGCAFVVFDWASDTGVKLSAHNNKVMMIPIPGRFRIPECPQKAIKNTTSSGINSTNHQKQQRHDKQRAGKGRRLGKGRRFDHCFIWFGSCSTSRKQHVSSKLRQLIRYPKAEIHGLLSLHLEKRGSTYIRCWQLGMGPGTKSGSVCERALQKCPRKKTSQAATLTCKPIFCGYHALY